MLKNLLKKIFGDPNEKHLNKMQSLVNQINEFEKSIQKLSNEKLRLKTDEFKKRLKDKETLDDILPESFAVAREASKRVLNQRHFDVQLLGGIILHQGKVAEMKTGEGKTLTSTLSTYLNALEGKGSHLVTANDYLAKRDAVWMGQIFSFLGLSIGVVITEGSFLYVSAEQESEQDKERDLKGGFKIEEKYLRETSKKEAYNADITYGTNNEFGFDYLRDNMSFSLENKAQRKLNFVIIDEADSILIDEARTPLIISAPDETPIFKYQEFATLAKQLEENKDYNVDEKMRAISLTEDGITKIEKILKIDNIYEDRGLKEVYHIEQALKAVALFKKDKNYIVKDSEIIIIDEFTGRLMEGRRYSGGLHQAIEAKESVEVKKESKTMATITFQNYFKMYQKISGMTGTAVTSSEEFEDVYNLEVIVIPTDKKMIRNDLGDKVYKTENAKYQAIVEEIKKRNQKKQPILVGTSSIEKNEYLGKLLERSGISYNLLNAKNHQKEGKIIAQAGEVAAVTVATNMAGRGVDIKLGGDIFNKEKYEEVKKLGGLFVLGTERHEARRIDNQLRGRAGRQGDAGETQFFISLEDDIMRIFGGEKIQSIMNIFKLPDDLPIENRILSNNIENAQSKIEGFHFDTRKNLLSYDNIMNKHRLVFYMKRDEFLELSNNNENQLLNKIEEIIKNEVKKVVFFHSQDKYIDDWNINEISENVFAMFHADFSETKDNLENIIKKENNIEETREDILKYLFSLTNKAYQSKKEDLLKEYEDKKKVNYAFGLTVLQIMDFLWVEHLVEMEQLSDSVKLRAYGQRNPLSEYIKEGHKVFNNFLSLIEEKIAHTFFKISTSKIKIYKQSIPINLKYSEINQSAKNINNSGFEKINKKKINRNDPCYCGSGKKYKKCCL